MSDSRDRKGTMRGQIARYGVALAIVAAAVLVRWPLAPLLGDRVPFITLFPAIAFVAWYCGRGPALLAIAVSSLAVACFIFQPRFGNFEHQAGLVLYVLIGLGFVAMFESLRRALRQAAEQRERLRTTIASIGDAVIATDIEGRITNMNAVAESLTGWTNAEAAGQALDAVFRIVNEQSRKPVENPVQKVLRLGHVVGLANHTILIAKDGTERPIDDSAAPIRCEDGEIVGCVLVFRDVTERREAERATRSLASIVESSDDAIIAKDVNGVITSWNGAAERLFGYSAVEAIGRSIAILAPPDRADEMPAILARLKRGEYVEHFDTVRRAKDGRLVPISLTVSPIKGEDGEIVGASKVARDISERKRAEAALHEQKERLHATLTGIGDAVIVTDADGRITMMNRVAETLTGWKEEAVGQPLENVFRIVNEQTRKPVESPATKALREGVIVGLANHTILIMKDGSERPIDDSAAPIRDAQEQILGCVLVFRDITERRRAAQQLADDKARIESIVNSAIDGIIAIDESGTIEAFNPAAERLFGYSTEEVVGQNVKMLMPEPFHSEHDGYLSNYRRSGIAKIIGIGREVRGRRKDGSAFPMDLAVSAFSVGGRRHYAGIVRDITDRKRSEEERERLLEQLRAEQARLEETLGKLSASEQRHRIVSDLIPFGTWEADEHGDATYLSPQFLDMTGQTLAEHRRSWKTLIHPDDALPNVEGWQECVRTGRAWEWEFRIRGKDGQYRTILARGLPLRDEAGQVKGYVGTNYDITTRTRVEDRLRLLLESAALLLHASDPSEMLHNLFAKISTHLRLDTYFNYLVDEGAEALTLASYVGIPEATARSITRLEFGQAICGTVALNRQPIVATNIQQSDDPKAQLVKSFGIRAYACNPLMIGNRLLGTLSFASRSRAEFEGGDLDFMRTICHYVAVVYERLRLVRQLQNADRRKDEFLATLAHELRNPLAPLRNGLQIIQLSPEREAREQARTLMERQLLQLVRLVDDLLDVSRISRGKIELRKEPVELSVVVNSAVETSRLLIEQMDHELSVTMPKQTIIVDADLTRLAQVFLNLMNNAAKYTEPGGRIWLTVERQGSDVVVSVKDTGIGIDSDHLPHIFEMFTQVDRSLEKSQGGLGIGLTLVKSIVEMHGGRVEAKSGGQGRGSEFIVRLPILVEASGPQATEGGKSVLPKSSLRILIVDDNRDGADSLAMMLKVMGNDTRIAYDGEEGVQAADEFRPDVVLLDIGLPKLNGYEACRRIREQTKTTILIAVTGWGQDEDRRRSHEAGFDHHMVKPVDPQALMKLLAELSVLKS